MSHLALEMLDIIVIISGGLPVLTMPIAVVDAKTGGGGGDFHLETSSPENYYLIAVYGKQTNSLSVSP